MTLLGELILVIVALVGLCLVRARETWIQALALTFYALVLSLIFFVFHRPALELSQISFGAIAVLLTFMLGLGRIRNSRERQQRGVK